MTLDGDRPPLMFAVSMLETAPTGLISNTTDVAERWKRAMALEFRRPVEARSERHGSWVCEGVRGIHPGWFRWSKASP
jgi:hypothetical protein